MILYRYLKLIVVITILISIIGCLQRSSSIERISISFPLGETRLLVQRNGDAFLFYGALPQHEKINNGTFNIDELYKQLRDRLHDNEPREDWINPKSEAGIVTIIFTNKTKKSYLIFDEKDFANMIFDKARKNITDHLP